MPKGIFPTLRGLITKKSDRRKMLNQAEPYKRPEGEEVKESDAEQKKKMVEEANKWQKKYNKYSEDLDKKKK